MTELKARELIEAYGKTQKDEDRECPRCGSLSMVSPMTHNALSRYAEVYICDTCGMLEAMRNERGQSPMAFNDWAKVKRREGRKV